ncbi:hypothetical protein DdX_17862 [Ditylenchus destructor]|uniref:Uncharacterized protein n=1 Tax=Ditylenchus destructor TaxID=166010 RepID=A0AAD4MR53_9BILA|nr:hypothetical protein DdX_17862 [Ditylenchus destructor]
MNESRFPLIYWVKVDDKDVIVRTGLVMNSPDAEVGIKMFALPADWDNTATHDRIPPGDIAILQVVEVLVPLLSACSEFAASVPYFFVLYRSKCYVFS